MSPNAMRHTVTTLDDTARAVVMDIADQFEHSWNAGDGAAYAEPFAIDGIYVTADGRLVAGRDAIARMVSDAAGAARSSGLATLGVADVRCVSATAIVARIECVLVPASGRLVGVSTTVTTMIVVETSNGWEVTHVHDTLVAGGSACSRLMP